MVNLTSLSSAPDSPLSVYQQATAGFSSWSLFQRPNNATAYAVGDVVSDAASLVTANQIWFPSTGTHGRVVTATLAMESAGATSHYELYVFDRPVTDHADNAALTLGAGDLTAIVGRWTFLDTARSAIGGNFHFYEPDGTNRWHGAGRSFSTPTGGLYGLLVIRSAGYTPTANTRVAVRLHIEGR